MPPLSPAAPALAGCDPHLPGPLPRAGVSPCPSRACRQGAEGSWCPTWALAGERLLPTIGRRLLPSSADARGPQGPGCSLLRTRLGSALGPETVSLLSPARLSVLLLRVSLPLLCAWSRAGYRRVNSVPSGPKAAFPPCLGSVLRRTKGAFSLISGSFKPPDTLPSAAASWGHGHG